MQNMKFRNMKNICTSVAVSGGQLADSSLKQISWLLTYSWMKLRIKLPATVGTSITDTPVKVYKNPAIESDRMKNLPSFKFQTDGGLEQ